MGPLAEGAGDGGLTSGAHSPQNSGFQEAQALKSRNTDGLTKKGTLEIQLRLMEL